MAHKNAKKSGISQATGTKIQTGANGKITLSAATNIKNQITGYSLKYGLDFGNYYLKEVELGASDKYVLREKNIYFNVVKNETTPTNNENYSDYAVVKFESDSDVAQVGDHEGKIANEPQKGKKILNLKKVNKDEIPQNLANTKFKLEYTSITNGQEGSSNTKTFDCYTKDDGIIYLEGTDEKVDISDKGTYVLTEIQATDTYMTPTDNNGNKPIIWKFTVGSDNKLTYDSNNLYTRLATKETDTTSSDVTSVNLTLKNDQTVVSFAKLNDIVNNQKRSNQKDINGEVLTDAELTISEYAGRENLNNLEEGTSKWTLKAQDINADGRTWTLTGKLKENTVYTLQETKTPVGYLTANPIHFKLFGTVKQSNNTYVSQVYVWTGSGEPNVNVATGWSKTTNLKDNNTVTMVDEVIIAPVDVQKVIKYIDNNQYAPIENVFFDVYRGTEKIGQAKSGNGGYLTWAENVESTGYGYVYSIDGKRIKSGDTTKAQKIVLKQSDEPYRFTEVDTTASPNNIYNKKESFYVNITANNYLMYRDITDTNHSNYYVDINEANTAGQAKGYTTNSKLRDNNAGSEDIVNEEFKAYIELTKYDADEEGGHKPLAGAKFQLKKDENKYTNAHVKGQSEVNTEGIFTTTDDGELKIEVRNKGNYTLEEIEAPTGYAIDSNFSLKEIIFQDADYDKTIQLKDSNDKNVAEVPNNRKMGTLKHSKKDSKGNNLNNVEYTLERIDLPANSESFLLSQSKTFVTGKKYEAYKDEDNTWQFRESTGEEGVIEIKGLNWGKYKLKETKELSGYKYDDTLKYEFEIDGTKGNNYLKAGREHENEKNIITIHKQNTDRNKDLKGAKFKLYSSETIIDDNAVKFIPTTENGKTIYDAVIGETTDSNATTEIVTGNDGLINIRGLETNNSIALNEDNYKSYYLVETKAPKGYILNRGSTKIEINRKGDIKVDNVEQTNGEVLVTNAPIEIYINKYGETEDGDTLLYGAVFTLEDACANCEEDKQLANGAMDDKNITVTNTTNGNRITLERLIGGHTYKLTETKAPDGYEATAEITFIVDEYGMLTSISSSRGYVAEGESGCAKITQDSLNRSNTISIRNEKIRLELDKVDYESQGILQASETTDSVDFTLVPYNAPYNTDAKAPTYRFRDDSASKEYSTTTGVIHINPALLIHGHKYLLKETKTISGYYIGKESEDGVILSVKSDGTVEVERQSGQNSGNKFKGDCPVIVSDTDATKIIARNRKATSFEVTKYVSGNMGDLNGTFKIKMRVVEPEGNEVGVDSINLSLNQTYDSDVNASDESTFKKGLPVDGILYISEDNDLDYKAIVVVGDKTQPEQADEHGVTAVVLNSTNKITIKLTNNKDVAIDIGVRKYSYIIYPMLALLILASWLFVRSRRQRNMSD